MYLIESQVIPAILCGGSGFPKQFLVLSGDDSLQSLFQLAVDRLNAIGTSRIQLSNTVVVTNEDNRYLVLDQLRELANIQETLLLEPVGCSTAPALTLAALYAREQAEVDPILVITPIDQAIQNTSAFTKALQDCIQMVASDPTKHTTAILGIAPTASETRYGYIKKTGGQGSHGKFTVEQFAEKPDAKTAQAYLDNGHYFRNNGMVVLGASTWLASLKEFRPDIFVATETAWVSGTTDQAGDVKFLRPDKAIFNSIPSELIDYAVIEKYPGSQFQVKVAELNAGWNDLGAWDAAWQVGKKDDKGNVNSGDTLLSKDNH